LSILDRIDATLDGLCPCGAEPREGSPYCSYDCEPNIVGDDTDLSPAGRHEFATPMRWRPDLVSAAPDEGLTLIRTLTGARFRRQLFSRDGTDRHHLRLDDGHRFVGCDIPADADGEEHAAAWDRLERELTDPRHTVPAPHDLRSRFTVTAIHAAPSWWHLPHVEQAAEPYHSPRAGVGVGPIQAASFNVTLTAEEQARIRAHFAASSRHIVTIADWLRTVGRQFSESLEPLREQLRAANMIPAEEPADLRERALQHVRNRNTGPQERARAPRRIDPRRGR
jgi:hypothetical protein